MTNSIETFFSAWSIDDLSEREKTVASAMTDGCTYADPMTEAPLSGPTEIATYLGNFVAAAPEAKVVVVDTQERHGMTRATVEFRMGNGMVQTGQYFVETNADAISRMIGFVGNGTPS